MTDTDLVVSSQDGSSLIAEQNPQGLDMGQAAQLLGLEHTQHTHMLAQTKQTWLPEGTMYPTGSLSTDTRVLLHFNLSTFMLV